MKLYFSARFVLSSSFLIFQILEPQKGFHFSWFIFSGRNPPFLHDSALKQTEDGYMLEW